MTHRELTIISAAVIAAGLAVGVVALLVLHLLPTGLSPVRNPVSQYGISRYRAGYRVQTIAYAAAGLGAAVGIAALPGIGLLPVTLCAVFAAARGAISWFPMDDPSAAATGTGGLHRLLATAAFLAVTGAAASLSHAFARTDVDPTTATLSGALAAVMLGALFAMVIDRRTRGGHFGLIERVFYLSMTAWLITLGVLLATTSR